MNAYQYQTPVNSRTASRRDTKPGGTASHFDGSPTTEVLARLERRIRHLEATADYVQELEGRGESLEREVQALHGRIDDLEQHLGRSPSPSQRGTNRRASGDSKQTPIVPPLIP